MSAPVTTWRYHIPNDKHEGWAVVFLDSIGCFSVLSDFGNHGYRWPENGWGPGFTDFRHFFLSTDDGYVLRKIAGRDVYDADATLDGIKRQILEARRAGQADQPSAHLARGLTKQRARFEWDLLEDHGDLQFEQDFQEWCDHTHLDEPWSYHCVGPSDDAKMFVKRVMPRLRAAIRKQLDVEAAATAYAERA